MLPLRSIVSGSSTTSTITHAPFLKSTRISQSIPTSSLRRACFSTTITARNEQPKQEPTQPQQQEVQPEQAQGQEEQKQKQQLAAPIRQYPYTLKTGTVVSAGRMDRTVRVAHRHTTWDKQIGKFYPRVTTYLVSDPRNSLREGDVIEFSSGYPKGRRVHHVVERIIAPFGLSVEERPAVLSREERDMERSLKRAAKLQRRAERRAPSQEGGNVVAEEYVGRIKDLIERRGVAALDSSSAAQSVTEA